MTKAGNKENTVNLLVAQVLCQKLKCKCERLYAGPEKGTRNSRTLISVIFNVIWLTKKDFNSLNYVIQVGNKENTVNLLAAQVLCQKLKCKCERLYAGPEKGTRNSRTLISVTFNVIGLVKKDFLIHEITYPGWKLGDYSGSTGGSSSMSKAQMEMRESLRRAGEGDKKLDDANFGTLKLKKLYFIVD